MKNSLILTGFLLIQACTITKTGLGNESYRCSDTILHQRTFHYERSSILSDSLIQKWARKDIKPGKDGGKVNNPRIWLARLHAKYKIQELNSIIQKTEPWGVPGTSWLLNKKGDYDFSLTVLTTILCQFGDSSELIFPETREHLIKILLTAEGGGFKTRAPRTLGTIPETENHILMTQGSKYLKNRWLVLHGNKSPEYDNSLNGLEMKLIEFLEDIHTNGLYEFNSMPYSGYTISALLNLEAFASDTIRKMSRDILDYLNFTYASGSFHFKYFPPMRRQLKRESWKELTSHYHTAIMKTWLSFLPDSKKFEISSGAHHALFAAMMPYRPSDICVELILEKKEPYFVIFGHGKRATPEIYDCGKDYLISGGGVHRGQISMIVSRPICLFLNDSAEKQEDVFHIFGPGTDFRKWNNTGVYRQFACAAGPVQIPLNARCLKKNDIWSIYRGDENLLIAVHSAEKTGIIALFEENDSDRLLRAITKANNDPVRLKYEFQFPGADKLSYDLFAPKNKLIIKEVNKKPIYRNADHFPLVKKEY